VQHHQQEPGFSLGEVNHHKPSSMNINGELSELCSGMQAELTHNILPFWMNQMEDKEFGGFFGRIDGYGRVIAGAEKGGILNARILWTFSSAFVHLKDHVYRQTAERAKKYILASFLDDRYQGTYWKVTHNGKPLDTKKQIYSQAFFIYAFSEFFRATADKSSLDTAISLFHLIENKSFDTRRNGYFEAYSREWELLEDLRLSARDVNEKKTTNTHLHILEAYTNLHRIWKDPLLGKQLANLIHLFLENIIDPQSHHLRLFFDEYWNSRSRLISYGHDIEASWLIVEAAKELDDASLLESAKSACIPLALAALEGFEEDGSLIYEKDPEVGHTDFERHWWPQAEAIVGLMNLFELTGNEKYLENARHCWEYICMNLIDREKGEWYWSILPDGIPNRKDDKAGFWKCPYHNGRACLEIMSRVEKILKA
jgi:mannobiose 2-epimerase